MGEAAASVQSETRLPSWRMKLVRPPLLWSKLRMPSPMVSIVERPRLTDRLLADPRRPIWLIAAPSGFGKTTLATRTVEVLQQPFVWLTVDARDSDVTRFWTHMSAGLAEVGIDVGDADTQLANGMVDHAIDELVAGLERSSTPLLIVLDDVHELGAGDAMNGLARLVSTRVASTTILLLTRHELALPLPRLRAQGYVTELDAADLAYTEEEAKRALSAEVASGLLDVASADEIVERTEGWPAGVRLAQLAARSEHGSTVPSLTGARPDIASYLVGEVFDLLDEPVREFLVTTSVLDDLAPGVCDAVTGIPGSLAVLRSLVAENVFTTLVDVETSTFRFHRLLREFCLSRLDERPEHERAELHRRAARWFARGDDADAVIRHHVAAGDVDAALATMVDSYLAMANDGRIDTLWSWVELVGAERVLAQPILGTLPAWASLNLHRYDEIEPWLSAIDLVDGLDDRHQVDFEIHAASIRCNRDRHLGLLDDALRHGEVAVALASANTKLKVAPTAYASFGAAAATVADARAGDALRTAIALAQEHGETTSVVMAYAYLGLTADQPGEAAAHADSALSMVTTPELERFHRPAAAYLVRARVERLGGRIADAQAALDAAATVAVHSREPAIEALLHVERGLLSHLVGDDATCRSALRSADALVADLRGATPVVEVVRAAHADTRFAPQAVDDLLPVGARELTERELVVLRMLPHELPRRELAAQLFVSENTIKTHLMSIRRKLGLAGRSDIVIRARELGLLPDG